MRNIVVILLAFSNLAASAPSSLDPYLQRINGYSNESYYKQKVYAEHTWKTFYALADAKKVIDVDNYDLHLLNAALFYATAKVRSEKGLGEIKFNNGLRDIALIHSHLMVTKKFFDHNNKFDAKLKTPSQRMALIGISNTWTGENIDLNYIENNKNITYLQAAEKAIADFLKSPPHRKTMLDKNYNCLGTAIFIEATDNQGVRYFKATQDYAFVK